MCLNGDIERQFEFVQQTWLGSETFHGLCGERDPIAGNAGACSAGFTIPTRDGPVRLKPLARFVTPRGRRLFLPTQQDAAGVPERLMVGTEGLEPSRPCGQRILSPVRLPIPPRPRESPSIGRAAARGHAALLGAATRTRARFAAHSPGRIGLTVAKAWNSQKSAEGGKQDETTLVSPPRSRSLGLRARRLPPLLRTPTGWSPGRFRRRDDAQRLFRHQRLWLQLGALQADDAGWSCPRGQCL